MAASCAAPRWLGGGLIALGIANEVDDHRWTITAVSWLMCLTAVDFFAYRAGAGFRPEFVAPNSDGYDK
jgi:hypothetical protein